MVVFAVSFSESRIIWHLLAYCGQLGCGFGPDGKVVVAHSVNPVPEIVELLRVEAEAIRAEDVAACRKIGENCLSLLRREWES